MNYEKEINIILKENMSERGYKLWIGIKKILPDIWNRPTSSSGKYHQKEDGSVPTNAHHTFEMLYASIPLLSIFNFKKKSSKYDMILFAISFHDSFKYGPLSSRKHTDKTHDKQIGDIIIQNKSTFLKLLNEKEFYILEQMVRFHSGRWSTDVKNINEFTFENLYPETLFIHMLDMMSTHNLIKILNSK